MDRLERWAAEETDDVTVVFERKPHPPINSSVIVVAHAPRARANSADDEIVRLVKAHPNPMTVRVITSDHWLADAARRGGEPDVRWSRRSRRIFANRIDRSRPDAQGGARSSPEHRP